MGRLMETAIAARFNAATVSDYKLGAREKTAEQKKKREQFSQIFAKFTQGASACSRDSLQAPSARSRSSSSSLSGTNLWVPGTRYTKSYANIMTSQI
jgi:hypothetical protein